MLIDLTHIIEDGTPVYPGDTATSLLQTEQVQTDGYSNHQLSINMHAGTHIDGPMHMLDGAGYIHQFALDTFIGEACLINASHDPIIAYREEYEQVIQTEQIVIIYTGHSELYGQPAYFTDYPVMTPEFAELLIRKKVKMVGLDTPSPDKSPYDVHKLLFQNHILIIENLTQVEQLLNVSSFEIIALPLRIKADSSIARVIARVQEKGHESAQGGR